MYLYIISNFVPNLAYHGPIFKQTYMVLVFVSIDMFAFILVCIEFLYESAIYTN